MPRSVSYSVLNEFLRKTGLKDALENDAPNWERCNTPEKLENTRFRVVEGAKNLIINCDGELEKSLKLWDVLDGNFFADEPSR